MKPGTRLGAWTITEPLGDSGTMFHASSDWLDGAVVRLVGGDSMSDDEIKAFIRDFRRLSLLRHPNVVGYLDAGREGDRVFVVMNAVQGRSLAAAGKLVAADVRRIGLGVGKALWHAHARGIVHGAVSPERIILRASDSEPILTDFDLTGIAHPLDPAHTAPERLAGREVEPSLADVYGLGQCLHEALTGVAAFDDTDPDALRKAKLYGEPLDPGPTAPHDLRTAVRLATDPDPAARAPDIGQVVRILEEQERRRPSILGRWAPWLVAALGIAVAGSAGTAIGVLAMLPSVPGFAGSTAGPTVTVTLDRKLGGSMTCNAPGMPSEVVWTIDGRALPISGVSLAVASDAVGRGSWLRCIVLYGDAANTSPPTALEDRPPAATDVAIVPPDPGAGADLACSATATDPDGDPTSIRFAWEVDGVVVDDVQGPSLPGPLVVAGAKVTCRATPVDWLGDGQTAWAAVVIPTTP